MDAYDAAPPAETAGVPRAAAEESARLACERMVRQDVVDEDASDEEINAAVSEFIRANPDVLYPICTGAAVAEFNKLTPAEQTPQLRREFETFGERYCEEAIRAGYISFGRSPTQEEVDRLFAENPELGTPVCIAGGMQNIDQNPLVIKGKRVSRAKAEEFLRRVCTEAIERGALSGYGDELTPEQEQLVARIAQRITREMIRSGELP